MEQKNSKPNLESGAIHPDELMRNVSDSRMGNALMIAIIVHVVLVGATSIGFIAQCVQYGTLYPKQAIKVEREEKAAAAKAAKTAELREAMKQKQAAAEAAAASQPARPAANVRGQSAIERAVTETSDERPEDASLDSLDDMLR